MRAGLVFFAVYLALYTGFVLLNAFAPAFMDRDFSGMGLATAYGIGLILAAIALAILYAWVCRRTAASHAPEPPA